MDWNSIVDNALLMLIVVLSSVVSYLYATIHTDKKIKQSEDKIWEYMKLRNKTEAVKTKSGMTRKL
jgi:exonuclease I